MKRGDRSRRKRGASRAADAGGGPSIRPSPAGRGLIFDPERGDLFTLNPTGALVFAFFRQGLDPLRIARRLARTFDVEPARALADVRNFLVQMRTYGIHPESAPPEYTGDGGDHRTQRRR